MGGLSSGVFRARPTAGIVANLTTEGPPISNQTFPRWSPDRTRVAYTANPGTGPNQFHIRSADGLQIAHPTSATDTSTFRARYNATGQRIAFQCGNGSSFSPQDVCVIADVSGPIATLDGIGDDPGGKVYVTDAVDATLGGSGAFAWNPVSTDQLAVVRDSVIGPASRPASKISLVNFDGSGVTALTPGVIIVGADTIRVRSMDWSPDGSFIVFQGNSQFNESAIYRVELASGVVTQLTSPGSRDDELPVISPDGSTILFIRHDFGGEASTWDLFTVPSGGGAVTQVTLEFASVFFGTINITFDWSPDGQEMVLTGSDGLNVGIYVIPATTTSATYIADRVLLRGSTTDVQPSWRP